MECYVHVGESAVGACVACGRFVCDVCRVDVEGAIWCKGCLAQGKRPPAAARSSGGGGSRPLRRSTREKLMGGVCGGMAEHFDFDVSAVRLVWVLSTLLFGTGLLAYVILWIVIPLEE
jgi:phage shock protein PspC (stress-responsive transcriptional regulator)